LICFFYIICEFKVNSKLFARNQKVSNFLSVNLRKFATEVRDRFPQLSHLTPYIKYGTAAHVAEPYKHDYFPFIRLEVNFEVLDCSKGNIAHPLMADAGNFPVIIGFLTHQKILASLTLV
jgi:hypothetical protein